MDYHGYNIEVAYDVQVSGNTAAWQVFALTETDAAEATALERIGYSFRPPKAEVTVLIPEAFTAPANARHITGAREKAESQAVEAVALLSEITSDTLRSVAVLLETAARNLYEQTQVSR